ncbi:MAG TPA: polysaccharide biosynthesis/export family protein, partial [Candidatus Tumulicola sp.]
MYRLIIAAALSVLFAVAQAPALAATPSSYVIHPGDVLAVSVYGETTLSQSVTVLPDGSADLPLIGRVRFGGLTTDGSERMLAQKLAAYIRKPMVTVEVTTQGQINVLMLGDVKAPGKYSLRSGGKLSDAIAAAGGLDSTLVGPLPVARVQSGSGSTQTASLEKLLREGDTSQDYALADNSVVYVQSRDPIAIEIVGAVDHPGDVELHAGDRLSVAIAKAGNSVNAQADLNHIFITRTTPAGTTSQEINLYDALQHGQLASDPRLQNGDVVYVPQAKKPSAN